jgi:hypothetical protein
MLATLLFSVSASAQLDETLLREIDAWRPGQEPPHRLLSFPRGEVSDFAGCGVRMTGDAVSDYLSRVDDPRLLSAIMLDWRADDVSVNAAARALIRMVGPAAVAAELRARRASASEEIWFGGTLSVLEQLLQSRYLTVRVARIDAGAMAAGEAEKTLLGLKRSLDGGTAWKAAYRAAADAHPRSSDSACPGTLVAYAFDGVISEAGFDILTDTFIPGIPSEQLREVMKLGTGNHILKGDGAVYLYSVSGVYRGGA